MGCLKLAEANEPFDVTGNVYALYERMIPVILKLAERYVDFDASVDKEDLLGEAYLAIHDAFLKFNPEHTVNSSSVKEMTMEQLMRGKTTTKTEIAIEDYAFWFLEKYFLKAVETKCVEYEVENADGTTRTMTSDEYYRNKKELRLQGCTLKGTRSRFVDVEGNSNGDYMDPSNTGSFGVVYPNHFDDQEKLLHQAR